MLGRMLDCKTLFNIQTSNTHCLPFLVCHIHTLANLLIYSELFAEIDSGLTPFSRN